MLGLENMQRELEERFSPLSNRRKSVKNEKSPQRAYSFLDSTDAVCSLDMVRLKLRFRGDVAGTDFDERAAKLPIISDYQSWVARVKPGGWRCLHTFGFGDSSATVGVGLMNKSCSIDMSVGFLEFNPNKVGNSEGFQQLLVYLRQYVSSAVLVRYDLAVDLDTDRRDYRLAKDGRKYACELSGSLTEYLGRRNAAGFVKLYDKQAESDLDAPLTRVEITCDGTWSVEKISEKWPCVYRLAENPKEVGLTKMGVKYLRLLSRLAREDMDSIEPELAQFSANTRKKYRDALTQTVVPFPESGAAAVLLQAIEWAKVLNDAEWSGGSSDSVETCVEYQTVMVEELEPAQVEPAQVENTTNTRGGLIAGGLPAPDDWLSEMADVNHKQRDKTEEIGDAGVVEGYGPVPSSGCVGRGCRADEGPIDVCPLE